MSDSEANTVESAFIPLSPEQGLARSAVINFCWDLELVRARSPDDPALSDDEKVSIRTILAMEPGALAARGQKLWQVWETTGGENLHTSIFSRKNMEGLLVQLGPVRSQYLVREEFRRKMAAGIVVPTVHA